MLTKYGCKVSNLIASYKDLRSNFGPCVKRHDYTARYSSSTYFCFVNKSTVSWLDVVKGDNMVLGCFRLFYVVEFFVFLDLYFVDIVIVDLVLC